MTLARILCLAASAGAAVALPDIAVAQNYPSRPVRIIVSFPSGSAPDAVARIVGNKLAEQMGQPMIVEPRPGGSGVIAVELAKNAAPDGYTVLLMSTAPFATLPALKPKLPYDPDNDFIALSRVASMANVVAVHPSLGIGTAADLVTLAKARPGELNYGSSGNGSALHLAGEMFNVLAGVKTVHVPYKGAPMALSDLVSGQLHFMIAPPLEAMPQAKSGKINVIATTAAKRDPLLPELPPLADVLPGFESTLWWGIGVPARTPAAIVKRLHAEIVKAMHSPEARELLARKGARAHAESPAEFTEFMAAERRRIAHVGRHIAITLD